MIFVKRREARRLKEKGVEILIALGHAGYREVDLQMAGEVGISKLIQTDRKISGVGTS